MIHQTCCDKNMGEQFTCGQLRVEIGRLKAEMEEAYTELAISIKERIDLGKQLAEARAEIETSNLRSVELIQQAYQNASRSILNDPLVTTYIAPEGLIYKQLLKRYGLAG